MTIQEKDKVMAELRLNLSRNPGNDIIDEARWYFNSRQWHIPFYAYVLHKCFPNTFLGAFYSSVLYIRLRIRLCTYLRIHLHNFFSHPFMHPVYTPVMCIRLCTCFKNSFYVNILHIRFIKPFLRIQIKHPLMHLF